MGERISWKKGKKCRSSDSIKRGKKKVYSSSRWGYYSRFLSMTRIRQRILDQKVWMGIDRFSSPHSGCLRFEFLVKMEGKKTLYDWGRSSSRLNQRHSFICLKSRCGETPLTSPSNVGGWDCFQSKIFSPLLQWPSKGNSSL